MPNAAPHRLPGSASDVTSSSETLKVASFDQNSPFIDSNSSPRLRAKPDPLRKMIEFVIVSSDHPPSPIHTQLAGKHINNSGQSTSKPKSYGLPGLQPNLCILQNVLDTEQHIC